MADTLEKARIEIDEIDAEMAALFVRRMRAAEAICAYKTAHGLPILDEKREQAVLKSRAPLVEDEILRGYYMDYLKEVMSISRTYQSRLQSGLRVAYSGVAGAFAHIATEKLFPEAKKVSYKDFSSAYRAVEDGECDVAVLPVENSYNGEVGQVIDLMFSGSLYVNGMYELPVTQDLLAVPGTSIEDVKQVVSHPQALGQCAEYISKHGFSQTEYENTALAARYVAQRGDASVAAIASAEAAAIFGLEVIDHDINSSRSNTTRFAIFTRVSNFKAKADAGVHSILLFTDRNEAGALARAVEVIGNHGFNMRCLRSRPMKDLLWQYYFYVEAEGNVQTERGATMMEELGEFCDRLKFAGTYVKR